MWRPDARRIDELLLLLLLCCCCWLLPHMRIVGPRTHLRCMSLPPSSPRFEIWDLAGQANLRPSWSNYYQATHAIIVVADSTDRWVGDVEFMRRCSAGHVPNMLA